MPKRPLTFDWHYIGQKYGEDFANFCGLLRIYELYITEQPKYPFNLQYNLQYKSNRANYLDKSHYVLYYIMVLRLTTNGVSMT